MARARNIKPGFYKNEDLAECSIWARFIFPGLWMLADREGRLEDRPKRIKGELLPFDGQDVEPLLAELASKLDAKGVPFIVRYQNSDGRFIQISKFSTHQTPHYSEKHSLIKPPVLRESRGDDAVAKPRELQEDSEKEPVIKGGAQPPDSLIPDSPNPSSLTADSRNPESLQSQNHSPGVARKPRSPRRSNGVDAPLKIAETWKFYAGAYYRRYGTDPVQNATVNGQLAQLVKRLGAKEAPAVAQFFVSHNRGLYVSAKHPVNLLLRDAEGLRTEWATGHQVTDTEARNADRTAHTGAVMGKLISEAAE
jgi:hypothetical protein